jgi:peroxiredoxin
MKDLNKLPADLPIPEDDGACNHLPGTKLPSIILRSRSDKDVDVGGTVGMTVIFFYPMNGRPDSPPMVGWNEIPGARGCTPQSCSYRDNYLILQEMGIKVFGISTQSLTDQKEAHQRLNLPFDLLNDSAFSLTKTMHLPTFKYEKSTYIKRITLIIENGIIKRVFYPVFPPNENVIEVIEWLENNNSFNPLES